MKWISRDDKSGTVGDCCSPKVYTLYRILPSLRTYFNNVERWKMKISKISFLFQ